MGLTKDTYHTGAMCVIATIINSQKVQSWQDVTFEYSALVSSQRVVHDAS